MCAPVCRTICASCCQSHHMVGSLDVLRVFNDPEVFHPNFGFVQMVLNKTGGGGF